MYGLLHLTGFHQNSPASFHAIIQCSHVNFCRKGKEDKYEICKSQEFQDQDIKIFDSSSCKQPCKISILKFKTLAMQKYSRNQLLAQVN